MKYYTRILFNILTFQKWFHLIEQCNNYIKLNTALSSVVQYMDFKQMRSVNTISLKYCNRGKRQKNLMSLLQQEQLKRSIDHVYTGPGRSGGYMYVIHFQFVFLLIFNKKASHYTTAYIWRKDKTRRQLEMIYSFKCFENVRNYSFI